ncbi:hypothetical protein BDQ17DRAFT_707274 [Cyathus striatus]|nr:hypothetical protein BDQ17DRAFT_707274 [Cyathus striatus]
MVHSAAFLRVARCASLRRTTTRNFPSLSRVSLYGPSTSSLPRPRFYTTKRKGTTLQPHVQTQSKPVAKEQSSQSSTPPAAAPTPGAPRHEAQEGTLTMSVPFNPPGGGGGPGPGGSGSTFPTTSSPLRDAILTTSIGLVLMFIGGIVYIKWYKANVLDKIEKAFEAGYDPALELAKNHSTRAAISQDNRKAEYCSEDTPWTEDLRRQEQDLIDQIVHGGEVGHYYLLLGPKVPFILIYKTWNLYLVRCSGLGKGHYDI